jgi:pyrimidine deaminase RibD-like protein
MPGSKVDLSGTKMRLSDFQIENHNKLDRILVQLCDMVIQGQQNDPDRYGMVAAAVLDPDNRLVMALNHAQGDKDVHGERAAIDKYRAKYGDIPEGSIIVTTCSPCTEPMPEREGSSCRDLISSPQYTRSMLATEILVNKPDLVIKPITCRSLRTNKYKSCVRNLQTHGSNASWKNSAF